MKIIICRSLAWFALAAFSLLFYSSVQAQGPAFTYQGRLNAGSSPANGSYDVAFTLFNTNTTGVAMAGTVTNAAVAVTNGLFTTIVNLGNVFTGSSNWLELAVRTNGAGSFTTLAPRQQLTPVPYAVTAANLSGTVAASSISGTLPAAQLPASVITNGASGVNVSGSFSGTGSSLTNVPLSALPFSFTNAGVVGWGYDNDGQIDMPATLNVTAVAAGNTHSLALMTNATVIGWGDNTYGEINIPAGLTNVTAIAAGTGFSLALKSNGTVVGWGYNNDGETSIPAMVTNVTAIAAGPNYCLALLNNGTVVGWGNNAYGQLNTPIGLANVTAIAAGGVFSLALLSNGTVAHWGSGGAYIVGGISGATTIAAGYYHGLALKSDGTVAGWGSNNFGQINIPSGLTNVTAIAAGLQHSLALKSDGTVIAWGDNLFGETNIPTGLANVKAIGAGSAALHSLAITPQVFNITPFFTLNGAVGTLTQTNLGENGFYQSYIFDLNDDYPPQTQSYGYYAKVGNQVYFEAWLVWPYFQANGNYNGAVYVSLPFPNVSAGGEFNINAPDDIQQYVGEADQGFNDFILNTVPPNGYGGPFYISSPDDDGNYYGSGGEIQVSGWYRWQ